MVLPIEKSRDRLWKRIPMGEGAESDCMFSIENLPERYPRMWQWIVKCNFCP